MVSDVGVVFPADESGKRSSLGVNQAIWADAVRGVAPELATRIEASRAWRKEYAAFIPEITALCATSRETAQAVAAAYFESARSRINFERDGETIPLADAPASTLHSNSQRKRSRKGRSGGRTRCSLTWASS